MTSLSTVLSRWVRRMEASPVDLAPKVWASHWANGLLGEFGLPRIPESQMGQAAFWMMSPFAFSPSVLTSFLFVDEAPNLYAVRLAILRSETQGAFTTYYEIPYSINDVGMMTLHEAEKAMWQIDRIPEALSVIVQRRLEAPVEYQFDDLFTLAIAELEKM